MQVTGNFGDKPIPVQGEKNHLKPEDFARALKDGIIDPEKMSDFANAPIKPSEKLGLLLKETQPLTLRVKSSLMPLTIHEKTVFKGNDLETQIKDPLYRQELMKHKEVKYYSITCQDPNRPLPEGYAKAKQEFKILNKPLRDLNREEREIYDKALNAEGDLETAIMMSTVQLNSLQTEYEKPAISITLSENGEIGEVASIATQSKELSGQDLMKAVDEFCSFISVDQFYLEDDTSIESPEGNYSMRLFRYFTGKGSWYEDAFSFHTYGKVGMSDHLENLPKSSESLKAAIENLGGKTVKEVQALFAETPLNKVLSTFDPALTMSQAIQQVGKEIRFEKKLRHRDMNALLTGYLEALQSYKGNEPEKLLLKEQADQILKTKFFRKSYS